MTLRSFADQLHGLFAEGQSPQKAEERRSDLARSTAFATVPELASAMKMLSGEKSAKMIAFLA